MVPPAFPGQKLREELPGAHVCPVSRPFSSCTRETLGVEPHTAGAAPGAVGELGSEARAGSVPGDASEARRACRPRAAPRHRCCLLPHPGDGAVAGHTRPERATETLESARGGSGNGQAHTHVGARRPGEGVAGPEEAAWARAAQAPSVCARTANGKPAFQERRRPTSRLESRFRDILTECPETRVRQNPTNALCERPRASPSDTRSAPAPNPVHALNLGWHCCFSEGRPSGHSGGQAGSDVALSAAECGGSAVCRVRAARKGAGVAHLSPGRPRMPGWPRGWTESEEGTGPCRLWPFGQ